MSTALIGPVRQNGNEFPSKTVIGIHPLLTPAQVGHLPAYLGKTLFGHVKDGHLRYVKVGRGGKNARRMFDPSDLIDFKSRSEKRRVI